VPLFDRRNGSGADWSLMLESLFRAGFQITDGRPDDEARWSLLRRVHEGSYGRLVGNSDAAEAVPSLSNTDVLKSSSRRFELRPKVGDGMKG
jgi:hypothetical protein